MRPKWPTATTTFFGWSILVLGPVAGIGTTAAGELIAGSRHQSTVTYGARGSVACATPIHIPAVSYDNTRSMSPRLGSVGRHHISFWPIRWHRGKNNAISTIPGRVGTSCIEYAGTYARAGQ